MMEKRLNNHKRKIKKKQKRMIMNLSLNKNLMNNQKQKKKVQLRKKKLIWQHLEFKEPIDIKKINQKAKNSQRNSKKSVELRN